MMVPAGYRFGSKGIAGGNQRHTGNGQAIRKLQCSWRMRFFKLGLKTMPRMVRQTVTHRATAELASNMRHFCFSSVERGYFFDLLSGRIRT
jgi:hypothetical protein